MATLRLSALQARITWEEFSSRQDVHLIEDNRSNYVYLGQIMITELVYNAIRELHMRVKWMKPDATNFVKADQISALRSRRSRLYDRKNDSQEHAQIVYFEARIEEIDARLRNLGAT
jgi:hypothetical protein